MVAAAVEVCLGEQRFESKSAAVNYVRDTLRKLVNTVVRPGDANFEVLLALFERHPHDQKKVEQPPVAAFRVVPNATLPQYCQLEFTDGRGVWEAISYKKCIDQKHDPPNIKHEEALRSVVEAQVLAFGAQQPQQCARCGSVSCRGMVWARAGAVQCPDVEQPRCRSSLCPTELTRLAMPCLPFPWCSTKQGPLQVDPH